MRNFVAVVGPRVAFLVALVTPLIPGTVSCAQSDMDDVKAVVAAYHAALSALDAPKMEALWVQDDSVMDIEPADKTISLGWDAVKKNFESEFNAYSELKVAQADGPHIQVKGDVAWSTGIAIANLKTKSGIAVANGLTFETDVFQKRGGAWLLVCHTALRVPQ